MRALIVEDNNEIREDLTRILKKAGFVVDAAADGSQGLYYALEYPIDIAIIDLGLPEVSGMDIIKNIRTKNLDYPVLILTARNRWQDRVEGLEAGADDYLTKPFNPRELTIRVRNILSRISSGKAESDNSNDSIINFNGWSLNSHSRIMTAPDSTEISIPRGEYRALRLLITNTVKIVTRQQLIKEMTGRELRENDRTVDVTIRRLRKHFESVEGAPELINTIHGEGYRFVGSVD